jgi:hypothetical protein
VALEGLSAFVERGTSWSLGQPIALVVNRGASGLKGWGVLAGVVGTEQELAAACKLHTNEGLRTAPVTPVGRGQRRRQSGGCIAHVSASIPSDHSWMYPLLRNI